MSRNSRQGIFYLLQLLLWLVLAACSPDAGAVPGMSTDIEIIYRREGGFAGITQEWTISPDGRIMGPGDQEMKVPPEKVIALMAKLKAMESLPLQETYSEDGACCDQFTYTIIVKTGEQETTLQTSDGADHPQEVSLLLADIEDLIAQAQPVE